MSNTCVVKQQICNYELDTKADKYLNHITVMNGNTDTLTST